MSLSHSAFTRLVHALVILALLLPGAPALAAQSQPYPGPAPTPSAPPAQDPYPAPPVSTPTPTPTPAAAAETPPTSTPTPPSGKPALSLKASSTSILPGETLLLMWSVANWPPDAAKDLTVQLYLPKGFSSPDADSLAAAPDGALLIPASAPQGEVRCTAPASLPPSAEVLAVLLDGQQELDRQSVSLAEEGLTRLSPQGGKASGFSGQVEVSFPPAAAAEALDVRVRRPSPAAMPPTTLSGRPFEILATGQSSQAEVASFQKPLTITVRYDPAQVGDENWLRLFYYDPASAAWLPTASTVDAERNLLSASVDHLTVFDLSAQDWDAASLPSLQDFQTAPFTGAASASLPIWTPPGPGGLQPELRLAYNSQEVDAAIANQSQASWVGMGWSLDTGAILRDMHATPNSLEDDTFSLSLGEHSSPLLHGADGYYHTRSESFWRIAYDSPSDTWTAWDGLGNRYTFGDSAETRARYPSGYDYNCASGDPSADPTTWRWSLHKLRNVYGQELTFTYFTNTQDKTHPCDANLHFTTAIAVYPAAIDYPHGRYQVVFERAARSDYQSAWTSTTALNFYQRYRLEGVRILKDGAAIRRYDFTYAANPLIHPANPWTAGGYTLTLAGVQEFGLDGVTALPAASFSYDALHLTAAANGYGGQAAFTYADPPWYDLDAPPGREYSEPDECIYLDSTGEWVPANVHGVNGGSAWCELSGGQQRLYVSGQAVMPIPAALFQPGAAYDLSFAVYGNLTAALGLDYGGGLIPLQSQAINTSQGLVSLQGIGVLPAAQAAAANLHIACSSQCWVEGPTARLLPTRYRVSQEQLSDGLNPAPAVTSYRYDEPATNDAAHSAAVSSPAPYAPAFSEFRGHALAQELAPDGRLTTRVFHQDDLKKGRLATTIISQQTFQDDFAGGALDPAAWSNHNGASLSVERLAGDLALQAQSDALAWRGVVRPPGALLEGQAVLAQFRLGDSPAQAFLALEYGLPGSPDFRRWGVYADGSNALVGQYHDGSGGVTSKTLFAPGAFKRNTWYVLVLALDAQALYLRAWERDNPATAARFEVAPAALPPGWHFSLYAYRGAAFLDAYSEGWLLSIDDTLYGSQPIAPGSLPNPPGGLDYSGLSIDWVCPSEDKTLIFEGDGEWVGRRALYQYGSFGNRLRTAEMEFDPAQNAWRDLRVQASDFFPNSGAAYLVGLPARQALYQCPPGYTNGACSTSYSPPASLPGSWIQSSLAWLYDGQTNYAVPPSAGKPSGRRTLLRFASTPPDDPRYRDESWTSDAWGNRLSSTLYSAESAAAQFGLGSPRTTSFTYDAAYHTFLLGETLPAGTDAAPATLTTSWTYDTNCALPLSETGPNGAAATVSAAYDAVCRLASLARPGDSSSFPTLQVVYSSATFPYRIDLLQRIDPGQPQVFTQRRFYDGLGRLVQSQTGGARLADNACSSDADLNDDLCDVLVDLRYDPSGRLAQQTQPYALAANPSAPWRGQQLGQPSTHTAYDVLGRPLQVSTPDGSLSTFSYSDGGFAAPDGYAFLQACAADPLGRTTCTRRDLFGRARLLSPPLGPSVAYAYDAADRLLQASRGGATTSLAYDLAGRKLLMSDPDMGTWSYAYDPPGNLIRQADARGQRLCLYYDRLGRLAGKHYRTDDACPASPASLDASYSYDGGTFGKGFRSAMSDPSGSTSWTYDARGRVIKEINTIDGVSYTTEWTYNSADLPVTLKYPDNELLSYAYHPQLALNTLMSNRDANNQANNYYLLQRTSYDASGRVDYQWLGATAQAQTPLLVNDYTFNPWTFQGGRLQRINARTYASQASLLDLRYSYDAVGNITSLEDLVNSGQKQCFGYDALDRLISARAGDASCNGALGYGEYADESYAYDAASGNLSSKTGMGAYTYGDAAHAHAVTSTNTGWAYQYDANGNMTRRDPPGSDYFDFLYDAENRISQVKQNGAVIAAFSYNGDGERVKSVIGGVTTVFVGGIYEAASGAATRYYFAGAQRFALRSSSGLTYLLGDHLSSTSVAYRVNDGQAARQLYMPWGAPRYASASLPTKYTFTGQYSYTDDLATPAVTEGFGLMFYNARWYDPYLNRWAQPDSIIPDQYNPLDWDRYAYARSNPLKYIDPDGHFPWLVLIGVLIYMATLPGDTGPYEVNPTTAAVGEAGLRMADPVDWFYTGVECLSGNCSGADIALGLLPFVNGGMDNAVDAAKALDSTGALAHADDVVETAGQFHHIFSNKIVNALNRHETLGGVFNRDDFIVQGLDAASHKGYQAWHRAYDQEVVNWLTDNPRATPEQFLSYLRDLYKRTEIDKRFPQAWQQLQMAIEEME